MIKINLCGCGAFHIPEDVVKRVRSGELVDVELLPDSKGIAKNVLKWGTGALNINSCRVGKENLSHEWNREWNANSGEMGDRYSQESRESGKIVPDGRFPANIIFDEDSAKLLDEQTGDRPSRGHYKNRTERYEVDGNTYKFGGNLENKYAGETGGASRFFYVAKSSKSERGDGNIHATVKPLNLMRYLVRLVTPKHGTVLEPFCGSGTTLLACEREEMVCKAFELDPIHCDIIISRWESMTGNKAEKLS